MITATIHNPNALQERIDHFYSRPENEREKIMLDYAHAFQEGVFTGSLFTYAQKWPEAGVEGHDEHYSSVTDIDKEEKTDE